MDNVKMITRENLPCWYELSFVEAKEGPSIILRIHKNFIKGVRADLKKLKNVPILDRFRADFNFTDFCFDFDKDIGFDGLFKLGDKKGEFVEFTVKIPKVITPTGKKCNECHGKGKDEEYDIRCAHCRGTGNEFKHDWNIIFKISANFTILTKLLSVWGNKITTNSSLPQLLTVETATIRNTQGGATWGEVSIPLKNCIKSFGEDGWDIPEAIRAMVTTSEFMIGPDTWNETHFRAEVRKNGRFSMDCPGDACSLYPDDWSDDENRGYGFSYHNLDTPIQQLTFIAGLAALCDRARKEIKI